LESQRPAQFLGLFEVFNRVAFLLSPAAAELGSVALRSAFFGRHPVEHRCVVGPFDFTTFRERLEPWQHSLPPGQLAVLDDMEGGSGGLRTKLADRKPALFGQHPEQGFDIGLIDGFDGVPDGGTYSSAVLDRQPPEIDLRDCPTPGLVEPSHAFELLAYRSRRWKAALAILLLRDGIGHRSDDRSEIQIFRPDSWRCDQDQDGEMEIMPHAGGPLRK